jgi:OFA family oxalate/formate antiporter-like MFS transporter
MKTRFNSIPFAPARWPFFYGWNILLWGIIGTLLSAPGQTTGVSAFTEPLLGALHISRLQLSLAYMIGTIFSSFVLTPAGKLYDRLGARWMGAASCFMLGVVLLILSRADHIARAVGILLPQTIATLTTMTVLFFLLRLSGQGVLTLCSRNMVMKWFNRRRGIASGITGVAVGYGFANTPRICHWLIEQTTWNGTWFAMAVAWIFIFTPLVLIFFRDNPEDCGLIPDGKTFNKAERENLTIHHQFTLPEARRTLTFWIFGLALTLHSLYITAITFHIESIFTEAGMKGARGFAMFPAAALVGIAASLIGGWLSDRIALRYFYKIYLLAIAGSMTGFILLSPKWIPLITVCFGISSGLFGLLISITWPKYFGRKHLGAISGLSMAMLVFGSAIGPMFLSLSLKLLDGYRTSLLICLGITLLLFIGSFFAHNPQKKFT